MTGKAICICSDSRTVSSRLVFQCQNSLQGLSIQNRVQLDWVPGHCSIIGNEEADGLARVGSKSNFYGPVPCMRVPKSLMTRMTKEELSTSHLSYWNLVSGCRQSKVWIKRPCLKLDRFLRNLPRTKLGFLIGLITGHVLIYNIRSNMCCLRHRKGVGTPFYMRVPNSGKPKNSDFW
jgi:hypothetical protein